MVKSKAVISLLSQITIFIWRQPRVIRHVSSLPWLVATLQQIHNKSNKWSLTFMDRAGMKLTGWVSGHPVSPPNKHVVVRGRKSVSTRSSTRKSWSFAFDPTWWPHSPALNPRAWSTNGINRLTAPCLLYSRRQWRSLAVITRTNHDGPVNQQSWERYCYITYTRLSGLWKTILRVIHVCVCGND